MPIYDMAALGERIRQQRRQLRLTQGEAAGLSGVSLRLWSEIERGRRENVSFSTVLRMLQTMGIDIDLVPRARTPSKVAATPSKGAESS